ncbi:hypothetical protein AC626_09670 [Pseudoalteromonas rubra]|uniref:Uncharacterized protein n=1 Tax=Pseudoalteromonas rubra TaxID=43658 RepID=A0A0L0EUR7_9GAMM|nr:hypothetical protein AC626_09670 [Pseudoalteromonas rubra]
MNALQCGPQGKIQDVFCHPSFSAITFKRTAFIGGFFMPKFYLFTNEKMGENPRPGFDNFVWNKIERTLVRPAGQNTGRILSSLLLRHYF